MDSKTPTDHLDPDTAASYLDRRLSGVRLEAAEAHLASCASCRAEIVEAATVIRGSSRPRLVYAGGAAAAAAAAVLLFVSIPRTNQESAGDSHRSAPAVARAPVELIVPKGAGSPSGTWRWQPTAGADRYELTVFEADGSVVWDTTTTQAIVLARPPELDAGRRYFWRVRARVGWEQWLSSDIAEFVLRADP